MSPCAWLWVNLPRVLPTKELIEKGEINASIILGGEARYKQLRSIIEERKFSEIELNENPDFYIKAKEDLYTEEELKNLGSMAVGYYASIETAIRKNDQEGVEEHKEKIASMYEEFSKIAAANDDGWINKPYSKEEILNSSQKNKMLAFPYNKLHCTSWNVNQSAALIICSEELADKLGIDMDKRVYPISSAENNHMIAIQQRPKLYESLGMNYAAQHIKDEIKRQGIKIDAYDLYSCFPAAVKMFSKSLGLDENKNESITGSMAYAGGPLNSFVLHSTVRMIQKIRNLEVNYGLVTGVSGMMTKQSFCIWGKKYKESFVYKDVTDKAKIKEITPNIPIISEESVDLKIRNNLKTYWLLDPIDGTKEYISGKDVYTLNAGLIIDCLPSVGIIGVPKKNRRTNEILKLLALEDKSHAYARTLSGGMRRRLLIAKAMVHQPPILILDEPTAGVDVELRNNLWENVKALNKEGVTIILTTHYLIEAQEMCDRIAIINKADLVALDTTEKLLDRIKTKKINKII